jgi:hypothetical protein
MKPGGGDADQNHYGARLVGDADAATYLFCSHRHLGDHRPGVLDVADDDRSLRQDDSISLQNREIMELHDKFQCLVARVVCTARYSRLGMQMMDRFEGGHGSFTGPMLRAYELASVGFGGVSSERAFEALPLFRGVALESSHFPVEHKLMRGTANPDRNGFDRARLNRRSEGVASCVM